MHLLTAGEWASPSPSTRNCLPKTQRTGPMLQAARPALSPAASLLNVNRLPETSKAVLGDTQCIIASVETAPNTVGRYRFGSDAQIHVSRPHLWAKAFRSSENPGISLA